MSANLKIILIVAIGVGACLLSVLSSHHFASQDSDNAEVLARIERVEAGIERIHLLGQSFVRNAEPGNWDEIAHIMDEVRGDLRSGPAAKGRWQADVAVLNTCLDDYLSVLTQLKEPATQLNRQKKALQEIGLTVMREVEEKIIAPFRREEGERLHAGESIDPFKSRAKDAAYDLVALHTKQQLILLELMLDLNLDVYKQQKSELAAALARHEAQLRYMSVLIGDEPRLQAILASLEEKMTHLLEHERAIIEWCSRIVELDSDLGLAGEDLRAAGSKLSSLITDDTRRSARLNQIFDWSLMLGIIGGMGILGALLARNIIRFVNDLRETRNRLEESAAVLEATLESSSDGVLVVTGRQTVSHCNSRFREIWSIPQDVLISGDDQVLIGYVTPQLEHPDEFMSRIKEIYRTAEPSEDTLQLKDGRYLERPSYPLTLAGRRSGRVWLFRDVTERKLAESERETLEAQLRQSQKMEAVGQLAGGVAHDFNNILTAIFGNVELAIAELESHHPGSRNILDGMHQIERSAQRASTLTRQLLAFSRRQVIRPEVLDLNGAIKDLEKMLKRLITEDIVLELVLAAEPATVRADPGQLEQVVMNLVVNARDAMPDGGTLAIETSNVLLDESYAASHPEAHVGDHVRLTVSDTGEGMEPATQERVFEPFFTTKPAGQGTGLGLSTTYGIIKQSKGHVSVYSEPARGTTFRIYLPLEKGPTSAPSIPAMRPTAPTGTETIITCEDDVAVRNLTAHVLGDAGYNVLAAQTPEDALRIASEHDGDIHLLLTDVIMPGMNGRKLADALTAIRPAVRTLFVSGYTSNVIVHHGVLDAGVEFMEKPYSQHQLLTRVREVLDGHKT